MISHEQLCSVTYNYSYSQFDNCDFVSLRLCEKPLKDKVVRLASLYARRLTHNDKAALLYMGKDASLRSAISPWLNIISVFSVFRG